MNLPLDPSRAKGRKKSVSRVDRVKTPVRQTGWLKH